MNIPGHVYKSAYLAKSSFISISGGKQWLVTPCSIRLSSYSVLEQVTVHNIPALPKISKKSHSKPPTAERFLLEKSHDCWALILLETSPRCLQNSSFLVEMHLLWQSSASPSPITWVLFLSAFALSPLQMVALFHGQCLVMWSLGRNFKGKCSTGIKYHWLQWCSDWCWYLVETRKVGRCWWWWPGKEKNNKHENSRNETSLNQQVRSQRRRVEGQRNSGQLAVF